MDYVNELFGLEGKRVAITGGGGVLAGAMAEALLLAGASVALWGIRIASVERAIDRLTAAGVAAGRVIGVECDAMSAESVRDAIDETFERIGGFDVLINAVGGNRGKSSFMDADIEVFESVIRLNLVAALMVPTQEVAKMWIAKGQPGAIINLASMASFIPLSGVWAYGAAKAAVVNLTIAAAKEFAPEKIRVNAIAPGFFLGAQNKALLVDEVTGELTPRGSAVLDHTPMERFGDASEIAGATLFLASERAAGFVSGITLPIDGGYLTHNI